MRGGSWTQAQNLNNNLWSNERSAEEQLLQREASALDSVRRDGTAHSVCVQADANFTDSIYRL